MSSSRTADHRIFKFKQFSLTDHGCGMKIGTDGVLLGSVAVRYKAQKVLDIGTGCGLIALMVAQKSSASITAIEIDEQAAKTAKANVFNSPWSSRILVVNKSFQEFSQETQELFDLVTCNPPFFHNSYQAQGHERTLARHSYSLSPNELFEGVAEILDSKGVFLVIIPYEQEGMWINTGKEKGLFCGSINRVHPNPDLGPKRSILEFSKTEVETMAHNITLETLARHQYTKEYIALTKDYYLFM